jgi:phosphoglycerate dehydrogenase-like enzyme
VGKPSTTRLTLEGGAGTADTEDFVGAAELAAMRLTAVFISIGRGSCVDEAALAAALHAGTIAGAAMDVYKTEPLPEHSALWDCPNLLMVRARSLC